MIIVVGGIKGGSGKNYSLHEPCCYSAFQGKRILLVDADEKEAHLIGLNIEKV